MGISRRVSQTITVGTATTVIVAHPGRLAAIGLHQLSLLHTMCDVCKGPYPPRVGYHPRMLDTLNPRMFLGVAVIRPDGEKELSR